jgi:A/G-specific adenine glycosylase
MVRAPIEESEIPKPKRLRGAPAPQPLDLPFTAEEFQKPLHAWYRVNARQLPWRGVVDPYATWLSEIMLQQTRVATVIDRYIAFLDRFPTIRALAEADEDAVLALWSGLGYYRRARMLYRGAQFVMRELRGKLPRTSQELRTLPGVGDYTAAAIASIAFGEGIAVVDGNVERVLLRILGLPEQSSASARAHIGHMAQILVPPTAKRRARSNPPGDHNQAMMELGAMICLPRAPLCLECPVMHLCRTRGEHLTPARREQRSRDVAHLLALRKHGTATEVLLQRRSVNAPLMPGMLELPPLPLDSVRHREPVLRLRHSITDTNYYVQIFTESAPGAHHTEHLEGAVSLPPARLENPIGTTVHPPEEWVIDEEPVTAEPADPLPPQALLNAIPANLDDLEWIQTTRLQYVPLTGLARKALQRLRVMSVPQVRIG